MPLPIYLAPPEQVAPALATMAFGCSLPHAINHTGLPPLSQQPVVETWGSQAAVQQGQAGLIHWQANSQCLFGVLSAPVNGQDIAPITYKLYQELLGFLKQNQTYPHLLRVWNYLPFINTGAGQDEVYQRFCVGRAQAFDENPLTSEQLPAGTAIGTQTDSELLIYFIATPQPGQQVENPRQVSAFDYPKQYSPRKPLFSRATIWKNAAGAQLIASGTASIVGHKSLHLEDFNGQIQETWRNLEALKQQAQATDTLALRVYIKHAKDYPAARQFIESKLGPNPPVIYLQADVCRAELLVEIEGVYAIPNGC